MPPANATLYGLLLSVLLAAAPACSQSSPPTSQAVAAPPTDAVAPDETKRPTNRLAKETSPYLLLHAHNPVDWYPWGEEAFARARKENKLVFLSIGYASCYWCHVMERQSFMDAAIADLLNKHFVCIKVDREERPDVDDIYMTSLQLFFEAIQSPQGGGWPLSMFLTPDAKPFMGGTYFPPRGVEGRAGFDDVLRHAQQLWKKQPDDVKQFAEQLAESVKQSMHQRLADAPPPLDPALLKSIQKGLVDQYDADYGGFGFSTVDPHLPKFPEPSNLMFLLARAGGKDTEATGILVGTLEKMARGGIYDQLGGGFHRYSTDRFWRVPHFEKMLYDNAQLLTVYAEAHALEPRSDFRRVIEGTIGFVLREMASPEGGFYAALDAETDTEEGRFYVWSTAELQGALAEDEFRLVAEVYGVAGGANFEGQHVLLLNEPWDAIAKARGMSEAQLLEALAAPREKLLAVRSQRKRPLTDIKVLTAWNGLMIRGMADAGRILRNEEYVKHAARAAEFVLARLQTPDGRLLRTYGSEQAKLNAYLEDYAFLVDGLIALHRATGDARWAEQAGRLNDKQIELFWDTEDGGFFFTSHDHESLIARGKQPVDSALPSGNAVAALNLIYLAHALQRPEYLARAEKTIQLAAPYFQRAPTAAPHMGVALAGYLKARGDENKR